MSIPTGIGTHFIMIQTGFSFGFFKSLFNGIARGIHLGQGEQGGCTLRIGQVTGDSLRIAKLVDNEVLQKVSCRLTIPWATIQKPLYRIRYLIPHHLGNLPGVLAFDTREQAAQVLDRLFTRFTARKQSAKASMKGDENIRSIIKFFFPYLDSPGSMVYKMCPKIR